MNGDVKMTPSLKHAFKIVVTTFLLSLVLIVLGTQTENPYALCIVAYTIGSIPFGYIFTKFLIHQDLRSIGSGNIGATNVLRTGRKDVAALTLICDALKGVIAVLWLASYTTSEFVTFSIAIVTLLGHFFPVWLDFKGGKGVATGLGILIALSWPLALAALGLWMLFVSFFRYVSLAAILSVLFLPIISLIFMSVHFAIFTAVLAALIILRHHENISRLIQGKEPKIGLR